MCRPKKIQTCLYFPFSKAPMALFYPAAFGIVGQKMTTLQHRSQGDPEDPHDEHYLLSTQSKQDQVHTLLSYTTSS